MLRKIIITRDDFNKEIYFFLQEVGAGMPVDWSIDAVEIVRNAVIAAFGRMGVTIETDDRLHLQLN